MKASEFFIFTLSSLLFIMLFSFCTLCADLKVMGVDFNNNDVICTGFVTNGSDDQSLTAMVYKTDNGEFAYMDNISVDKDGYFRLTLNTKLLNNGSYNIRIGGKNITKATDIYMGLYTTGKAVIWGDTDGDGNVTAFDAANTLEYSLNNDALNFSPAVLLAIDVNADGYITAANAATILQKSLNFDYKMPVEVN